MYNKLTTTQIKSLEDCIYSTLMGITMISNEGEEISFGLGEMGEVRQAAQIVISEWMEENNITEQEND